MDYSRLLWKDVLLRSLLCHFNTVNIINKSPPPLVCDDDPGLIKPKRSAW